jgi:hypothetical protein
LGLGPQPGFKEEKGKSINFKCWANGGLRQLTYFDYLIGKMFTIDFALLRPKKLVAEDWQDEWPTTSPSYGQH